MQIGNYEIQTRFFLVPSPSRKFDWTAWCDGHEEWKIGYGPTELDAINDLREQLEEEGAI